MLWEESELEGEDWVPLEEGFRAMFRMNLALLVHLASFWPIFSFLFLAQYLRIETTVQIVSGFIFPFPTLHSLDV